MAYERIRVEPLSPVLGAEISGVDLARLSDAEFEEIHRAWLEHQVVFFRDQKLTAGETLEDVIGAIEDEDAKL